MNTARRAVAQLLLMFPAVLFMGALAVRWWQPLQNDLRTPLSGSLCSLSIPSET